MSASATQTGLTAAPRPQGLREADDLTVSAVYEQYAGYVHRCLRGLGVRDGNLEDGVHDVFLVVNEKLHGFDGAAKLSTWLYAIVLHVARRYRARQGSEGRASRDDASTHDSEAYMASREQLALAQRALSALDDEKREVFVLCDIEQMSAVEAAEIVAVPLNTVYSRLRAARLEFERQLRVLHDRPRARRSGSTP